MFAAAQFHFNNSVNKITEKAPFDIIYRYKPEIRMNIAPVIKNSSLLEETPAARQKIELREKDKKTLKKL